ncbi:MAG: ABC transporter C-terminal domain-containing protein, partial [Proteobacteria bacterium]|nr:ABC transporter C-terminal domain-containing protein [Pseudomonadota bacterium]
TNPRQTRKKPARSGQSVPPHLAPHLASKRLSFKEKHALEVLPRRIAGLEKELSELSGRLSDPALFAQDAAAFNTAAERHKAAQRELADAEEEWLALEILREDIEV